MKIRVFICSNAETLTDGYEFDSHLTESELAGEISGAGFAAADSLLGFGPDIQTDSCFRHWNGGKYDQFYKRCGNVAIDREYAGTSLETIAWQIDDAIAAKRAELAGVND